MDLDRRIRFHASTGRRTCIFSPAVRIQEGENNLSLYAVKHFKVDDPETMAGMGITIDFIDPIEEQKTVVVSTAIKEVETPEVPKPRKRVTGKASVPRTPDGKPLTPKLQTPKDQVSVGGDNKGNASDLGELDPANAQLAESVKKRDEKQYFSLMKYFHLPPDRRQKLLASTSEEDVSTLTRLAAELEVIQGGKKLAKDVRARIEEITPKEA